MRGGTVNCEIVVSDMEVSSVHKKEYDYALVLNQQSFDKFVTRVKSGGTIVANSTLVSKSKPKIPRLSFGNRYLSLNDSFLRNRG